MKRSPSALVSFFADPANKTATTVDLYTFALTDGSYLRWAEWPQQIALSAADFPSDSPFNGSGDTVFAVGPRFGRSRCTAKIGVDPTELDLQLMAGPSDLLGTFTIANAMRMGIFDDAQVEHNRLFAADPVSVNSPLGCLTWFHGRIAEIDIGRTRIDLKVKSLLNDLQIRQFPIRLFGSPCGFLYGGARCGYDRTLGLNAAAASTGIGARTVTAASGSTQAFLFLDEVLPLTYAQGTATGLAGANAGVRRTVKAVGDGVGELSVFKAWLYPVSVGDTFTVLPGCNHTVSVCDGVMNNLARYGGFPHIPPPEDAV